jgi:phosphotransferase system enzyme I (PtsI)
VLLLGMGLRSFSMSPAFLPSVKQLASHVSIADAQAIFKRASAMKTTAQVHRYVLGQVEKLAPELEPMFQHE